MSAADRIREATALLVRAEPDVRDLPLAHAALVRVIAVLQDLSRAGQEDEA